MSFARLSKGKEIAIIATLLSIFGVVREQQMRALFSHLADSSYGRILSRLRMEGLGYRTPDAKYIASSKFALEKTDTRNSIACFEAFILVRDKIQDFCSGAYPATISITAEDYDYDIIPVSSTRADAINESALNLPDRTVRYLVTTDLATVKQLQLRPKNDFILLVLPTREIKIYKSKGVLHHG